MRSLLIVLLMFGMTKALFGDYTDQRIKRAIIGSWSYTDDMDAASRSFDSAWNMCNADSNRLARLLYEISLTNNAYYAESAMGSLTLYGTPAQLPYLYSVVTNKIRGAEAAKAILRIEGVTTNSILAVSNCIRRVEIDDYERYKAFRDFVEMVYRLAPDNPNRNTGIALINDYVRNDNMYCKGMDKVLIKEDPTYRTSKRRLADLRSAINRGVHEFQLNYITNAINELVAYPEADLPE